MKIIDILTFGTNIGDGNHVFAKEPVGQAVPDITRFN